MNAAPMIRLATVGGRVQLDLADVERWHLAEFDLWRACGEAETAAAEEHMAAGHLRVARSAFVSARDAYLRGLFHYRAALRIGEAMRADPRVVPIRTAGGVPCAAQS